MKAFCGNNLYDAALKRNGGTLDFGTHAECYRKGYAIGLNQRVTDVPHFVQKWSGKYKAYIEQKLWHSADPVPSGYQRAILSQTMQRGFAFGSMALAKQLARKGHSKSLSPKRKLTLSLRSTKP
ncbi:MAG: hypothetical protein CMJ62_00175 [Planctomycetaceae bacterium]|nr:hypothetical protein [Planctomycetaceae bacterium]